MVADHEAFRVNHSETDFHITVAAFLRRAMPPEIPWTTIAHGAYLGDGMVRTRGGKQIPLRVVRANRLKLMGANNGWPDIIVLRDGGLIGLSKFIGLELKSQFGSLSDDQKSVHAMIRGVGGSVHVCKTLEQVESALRYEAIILRARASA